MIDGLLQDGRIVIGAMAFLLAELAFAGRVAHAHRRGFVANAAAGLALLGALYCALAGLGNGIVAAFMAVGLIAHLAYLASLAGRR